MTPVCFALDRDGRLTETRAITTIVFTAHNRRELVMAAIEHALRQTIPLHIIVADDASSDNTEEAVRAAWPGVTYLRSEVSRGPCYQRNRGVEAAVTEIVFPLDDDTMLVDPETLAAALRDFADPAVAIVAMPFVNVLKETLVRHAASPGASPQPFDYAACAHGVRRATYLSVGGYTEDMFYMHEEGDLALRLYDSGGWRMAFGNSPVVHHMQHPTNTSFAADYFGARNKVLFYWRHAPLRYAPVRIAGSVVNEVIYAVRRRRPWPRVKGLAAGLAMVLTGRVKRAPVKSETFRAYLAQR